MADGHELVGLVVALVVRHLRTHAIGHLLGQAEARNNVPADAAPAQVVERGEAPRSQVRRGAGGGQRDANAQMLGGRRHDGHQRHRVMVRP